MLKKNGVSFRLDWIERLLIIFVLLFAFAVAFYFFKNETARTFLFLMYLSVFYIVFLIENGKNNKRILYDVIFIAFWMMSCSALEMVVDALVLNKLSYVLSAVALIFPIMPFWVVRFYNKKSENGQQV